MYSWLPLFKVTIFTWLKVLSNLHIHCTSIILLVERTPVLDWQTFWSNHCSWRKVHLKWSDDLPILNSSFFSPSWEIFLFQSDGGIFSCLYPSYWSYNNRNLPWNREIKNIILPIRNETLNNLPPFCLFCLTAETLQAQCSRQDGRAWKSRGCMFDWYLAPFLYMNHLKIHNSYITVYLKICCFNYFRKRCRFRRALDVVLPLHNTNFP